MNLPSYLTRFVGREPLISRACIHVMQGRLISLVGIGGVGKTRLATVIAQRCHQSFEDGVYFVDLAAVSDSANLAQRVARSLGLAEQPELAWRIGLTKWLQPQRALLILDNCEHILSACTDLAKHLLDACPQLTILATSREALGVRGEFRVQVPSLSFPAPQAVDDLERFQQAEVVQLFCACARRIDAAFAVKQADAAIIFEICRRLDGIPLAIELVTPWLSTLTLSEILTAITINPQLLAGEQRGRQASLQATIEWSFHLLSSDEAEFLTHLCVFPDSFSLAAAEAVTGSKHNQMALRLLRKLVGKSLINVFATSSSSRYRLPETIKQFARQQIEDKNELKAHQLRLAHYFLNWAETSPSGNFHQLPDGWLAQLTLEQANLRQALTCFYENGMIEEGLRLAGALRVWFFRYSVAEAVAWVNKFMALADAGQVSVGMANALLTAGFASYVQGRTKESGEFARRGIDVSRELQAPGLEAMFHAGYAWTISVHRPEAWFHANRAVELARADGDPWTVAWALHSAGVVALRSGRLFEGHALEQESRARFVALDDRWGVAMTGVILGYGAIHAGELNDAAAIYRATLPQVQETGDRWNQANILTGLAFMAVEAEQFLGAVDFLIEAYTLYQEIDNERGMLECFLGIIALSARIFTAGEQSRSILLAYQAHQKLVHRLPAIMPYWSAWPDFMPSALASHQATLNKAEAARVQASASLWSFDQLATTAVALGSKLQQHLRPRLSPAAGPYIRITGFGRVQVWREEKLLLPRDWTYPKAKELLFYLLTHAGESKANIGLVFWPDDSPAQLRRKFHDTLYSLRQALGDKNWIQYERGQYTFKPIRTLWADFGQFRQLAAANEFTDLEAAIALYQGDFLDDAHFGDWMIPIQEEYRRQFLSILTRVSETYLDNNELEKAIVSCRRLVEKDPLSEAGHRALMRCFARQGDTSLAMAQYERMSAILREELDITPSPGSQALYQQLKQGKVI